MNWKKISNQLKKSNIYIKYLLIINYFLIERLRLFQIENFLSQNLIRHFIYIKKVILFNLVL